MKYNRAFTLIELLVVIAIIAILAAILFPVFAQAKLAAKKTVALSDVKQLGLATQMYLNDSDDTYGQSETGSDGTNDYLSWCTIVYPYIKNGDFHTQSGVPFLQSYGSDGIFRSPGNPRPVVVGQNSAGAFSFGIHHALWVDNDGYENAAVSGGAPNPTVSASAVTSPADLIQFMEKGTNDVGTPWNYPWFHDWQQQWVGAILNTPGDPSTIFRDGDDSVNPNWDGYTPNFDTDCAPAGSGAWECAAHARYRYTNACPMSYADGHAKTMSKGQLKWFKNIWLDRRNMNNWNWYYGYMNGSGWGFPGIH
jgi:prepilin-type N-terminal cleavage/methylation domain-containing protein